MKISRTHTRNNKNKTVYVITWQVNWDNQWILKVYREGRSSYLGMVFFQGVFTKSILLLLCSFSKNQTIFVLLFSSFKFLPEFRAHFMDLKLDILQPHIPLTTSFQSIVWVNTVLWVLLTSLQLTCKWK